MKEEAEIQEEARAEVFAEMRSWADATWPHIKEKLLEMIDDLAFDMIQKKHVRTWKLSDAEKLRDEIRMVAFLEAASAMCRGCREGLQDHACRAVPIRALMARMAPGRVNLSPRDWTAVP